MRYYSLVINFRDCLPDNDPWIVEIDDRSSEFDQVLDAIYDVIMEIAPHDNEEPDGWDDVLVKISLDKDTYPGYDIRRGIVYDLPDGYVIEAAYHEGQPVKV